MKGSKKLGKSILVIALSLVLIISAVAPLTVMGSENYGGGSKGTALGQYRYYVVQSNDTLSSIANKNGITVSDIMTYNGLDSTDEIYRGQILKLPVTSENTSNKIVSTSITVKAKDSNVKDLVSSIAYNAGYTVIYKGAGTETVTVELEKVSPLKAIDYVTRMVGLSYLKDGNTILVASAAELNGTFVDSLVLTKFSFDYITYDELLGQASALGLGDMKTVSQTNNGRDVWISAYPKEMAKLAELVEILDAPENISVGSSSIASAFTPIELDYISASDFSSLLSSLGLHEGITMAVRPMTLFVYVSGTQLADIMTIKKIVDTEDVITLDGTTPSVDPDDESGNDATNDSNNGSSNSGDSTTNDKVEDNTVDNEPTTTPDNIIDEEVVEEPKVLEKIEFINLVRSDVESYIKTQIDDVIFYGHERMTKAVWMYAKASDVEKAKDLIATIDASVPEATSSVHTYTTKNCSVNELLARLEPVESEGVKYHIYDHPEYASDLIVYCDDVTWNNEVLPLLEKLDTVDEGAQKVWMPLDSMTGDNTAELKARMESTWNVMKELYPEIFGQVDYKMVTVTLEEGSTVVVEKPAEDGEEPSTEIKEVDGSYKVVLYVNATSSQMTRMQELLKALDEA